jgi:Mg2+-importing ATPase
MSKHKVIVKELGTIQSFGEMDILCTDKTGTLTEDKIVVEKYMNVHGDDDYRVLRHAFLNSYFQTGLKNLIDHAIIKRGNSKSFSSLLEQYYRVDEIPFDFSRRRMSVVLQDEAGKRQLITKGAVEEMIEISSFVEVNGKVIPLDEISKQIALETYEKYNNDGLRIIAVAQKNEVPGVDVFSIKDESEMVLIGFIGFLDPPKESSKSAIIALKDHGVRTIVLTGDSGGVTKKVCNKVGISTAEMISGLEVEAFSDNQLKESLQTCDIYYKLSPSQKERIVSVLQADGHTVGFMGDGINDAQALRQADIGISVDSAVDIAKETADIILLEKDLMVLEEGVLEGRKTFGNINKYLKMALSGNFGNIISVVIASLFLPFYPIIPVQLLTQNLLNDFSQIGIPFDKVDSSYIRKPRKWDPKSIMRFMFVMGPISTIFDILCFGILWWIVGANTKDLSPLFQSGWFVFGTISQILVIYVIRTARVPFLQSRPSKQLFISTLSVAIIAIIISFSNFAISIDMMRLPITFLFWLIALSFAYILTVQWVKHIYIKRFKEWL